MRATVLSKSINNRKMWFAWIPAFAGMTDKGDNRPNNPAHPELVEGRRAEVWLLISGWFDRSDSSRLSTSRSELTMSGTRQSYLVDSGIRRNDDIKKGAA